MYAVNWTDSPLSTLESNVRGTWNLLEACRQNARLVRRVVVASSDKAYGAHERLPYTEDTPLQGRFPYDVSKSCADLIALSFFHTYRTPVAITRLIPSETTLRASMSSPESVSSRIASFGCKRAICSISSRFFSPPEKPSLT